jgi:hypothetical protein
MSITSDIRQALRKAPGAITMDDLFLAVEEKYTKTQLFGNIKSLVVSGEVIRERLDGEFTYLLDSSYVPKRTSKKTAVPPAGKAKKVRTRALRDTAKAGKSIGQVLARVREAKPQLLADTLRADLSGPLTVSVLRDNARTLALAVCALHPKPMPPELKEAVAGVILSTL